MEEKDEGMLVNLLGYTTMGGFGERETITMIVGKNYYLKKLTIGEGMVLIEEDEDSKRGVVWVTSDVFTIDLDGKLLRVTTDFSTYQFQFINHYEREVSGE